MSANKFEDDIISYCGSISGETFSSRRRKNTCSLRQHSVDILAQKLREHSFEPDKNSVAHCNAEIHRKNYSRFNKIFHSYRFIVTMFGGVAVGIMMLLRYNVTVAILKMVNQTALYMEEHPDRTMDDFLAEGYLPGGEFVWDNEIQHMIMSWYMVAYTLPQTPCTKLGIKVGARISIPISLFLCSVSTLLTPSFSYFGWKWVILLRLINGVGASAVLPMMLSLIENWMPYDQMSLGLTCAQVLQAILTATNPLIAGYLSSIHWSYAFYVPGICTLVFCILWIILITDRPDENWLISQKELDSICSCQLQITNQCSGRKEQEKSKIDTDKSKSQDTDMEASWVDVLKVPSFYFYIIMWCFYCSSYSSFSFILPTYLRQFLKIKISQNGFYCFIIQSGCILSVLWPHPFLRFLQSKRNQTQTVSRRLTYTITCFMVCATWVYVGLFHESQLLMLFLNRTFQGSTDIIVTGTLMRNYAKAGLSSMVFSMVNTVGNLSVVFASTGIGYVLDYTGQSREGWSYIYIALGLAQLIMLAIFVTTIDAEPIELGKPKNVPVGPSVGQDLDAVPVEVVVRKDGSMNNFNKLRAEEKDRESSRSSS